MNVLALLLSGVLAGLLSDAGGVDFSGGRSVGGVLFSSGGGTVAIAVLVASSIAMVVRRRIVLAGYTVVAAAVAGSTAAFFPSDVAAVLAGGVILGCAAVRANSRVLSALLIGSFLLGLLCAGAVEALQHSGMPRRYADYLTESHIGTAVVVPVLCLLVVVTTVWTARQPGGESPPPTADIRTAAAALLVPLGGLLLDLLFVQGIFEGRYGFESRWYFGLLAVPALFAAAALMPGRGGMLLFAGSAVLLTSTTTAGLGIEVSDGVWVLGVMAVVAAAVAVGTALGLRWGRPQIGITILAMVCGTALFENEPLDTVHYVASGVIFPAAAAYLFVACLPVEPPTFIPVATTLGLVVPVAITVPMIVSYGWTAYTPLTSALHSGLSPRIELWLSTSAAVLVVGLAGVGMWALGRRPLPVTR